MAGWVKYAGALLALATCSACAGVLRQPFGGAQDDKAWNGAYLATTALVNGVGQPLAMVLPDRKLAQSNKFEYIINAYGSYASIFDYPPNVKQIGKIANVGGQGCTNVLYGYGKKIVWIVAGENQISEYEVPKTPIKTLSVPYYFPSSCAMDTSGDLAVGILYGSSYGSAGAGDVVIFKNASGSGTAYSTPLDEEFFDGYDPHGNLFADGFTGDRTGFALVELPKGGTKFEKIKTSNTVNFPGSVQWDGTYLTVTDQRVSAMYRYTVSGRRATLKGTVSLKGAGDCAQTWIATGVVYCADARKDGGEVYKYPAGGKAIAILEGNFVTPLGTTAAQK